MVLPKQPNRRARRDSKYGKQKRLIDEPKSGGEGKTADKAESGLSVSTTPHSNPPGVASQPETGDPQKIKKEGEHIMWPLVAMWAGIKSLFDFLDRHDGSITALATVAIVVLTSFYVGYSQKQWEVMQGQLRQIESQTRPWVGLAASNGIRTSLLTIILMTCTISYHQWLVFVAMNLRDVSCIKRYALV
jgi:hypothetical protein